MRRKYTALFPFDVALWEDISHRTLAAFRQAFIQGPGTNSEVLASLDQSPSVLRFWKVSRVSLFTCELCVYRGCIANWPGDLNYILCFLEDSLPPSPPTLLAHTSQGPLFLRPSSSCQSQRLAHGLFGLLPELSCAHMHHLAES